MKLCTSTGALVGKYGLEEGLKIIADAGFDGVDFGFDLYLGWNQIRDGDTNSFLFDLEKCKEFAKELKRILDKLGLKPYQCHAPFPSRRDDIPEENNALVLESIKNCFYMCEIIGCKKLVVHPFVALNITKYPTTEVIHEANMKLYVPLIETIKETGVICCLENMFIGDTNSKRIYAATCSDISEACQYVDELNEIAGEECFGFCLDIGHLLLVGLDPYNATLKLGKRIVCFHVHDNNGLEDLHVSPYLGICHWDRFAKAVREIGYTDPLDLEAGGTILNYFREDGMAQAAYDMLNAAGRHLIKEIEEENRQ